MRRRVRDNAHYLARGNCANLFSAWDTHAGKQPADAHTHTKGVGGRAARKGLRAVGNLCGGTRRTAPARIQFTKFPEAAVKTAGPGPGVRIVELVHRRTAIVAIDTPQPLPDSFRRHASGRRSSCGEKKKRSPWRDKRVQNPSRSPRRPTRWFLIGRHFHLSGARARRSSTLFLISALSLAQSSFDFVDNSEMRF